MTMEALFVVSGIALTIAGFARFIYLMEHSARYSPNAGGTQVLLASILMGAGAMIMLAPLAP